MDGWQLRAYRERLDITLRQLAHEMGVERHGTLSDVETGKVPLTPELEARVVAAIGRIHHRRTVAVQDLYGRR